MLRIIITTTAETTINNRQIHKWVNKNKRINKPQRKVQRASAQTSKASFVVGEGQRRAQWQRQASRGSALITLAMISLPPRQPALPASWQDLAGREGLGHQIHGRFMGYSVRAAVQSWPRGLPRILLCCYFLWFCCRLGKRLMVELARLGSVGA